MSRRARILTGVSRSKVSPAFSRLGTGDGGTEAQDPFEEVYSEGSEGGEGGEGGGDGMELRFPRMSEEQVHLYKEMNRFRRQKDLELRHRNLILLFTVGGSIALIILYVRNHTNKQKNTNLLMCSLMSVLNLNVF